MDIRFSSGEKVVFSWREAGALHIDIVAKPMPSSDKYDRASAYPVAASKDLSGEELLEFIQNFLQPILRRSLAIALEFPAKKNGHSL